MSSACTENEKSHVLQKEYIAFGDQILICSSSFRVGGDVVHNGIIYDTHVHTAIVMDNSVAQALQGTPCDFGVPILKIPGQLIGILGNPNGSEQNRVLQHLIFPQLILLQSRCVSDNETQIGTVAQNRVAASYTAKSVMNSKVSAPDSKNFPAFDELIARLVDQQMVEKKLSSSNKNSNKPYQAPSFLSPLSRSSRSKMKKECTTGQNESEVVR